MKLWPSSLPFIFSLFTLSLSTTILTPTQPLLDGETLVSNGGTFALGFFSPCNSNRRYLAVWYHQLPVQTAVWVANRRLPLLDRSGLLRLSPTGNLTLIQTTTGSILWSTTPNPTKNPVAKLLDSGNLIVRDRSDHGHVSIAWQSFHYPTDTWLPGMKFWSRFEHGLTSWKEADDPAPGDYTVRLDESGLPQMFLFGRSDRMYRTGPWNGLRLSGTPEMTSYTPMFSYFFVTRGNETYYEHRLNKPGLITRLVLDRHGSLQRFVWVNRTGLWEVYWSAPRDQCDMYGSCGPYGVCSTDGVEVCRCLDGFVRRSGGWAGGCVRRTGLVCGDPAGFKRVTGMKLPDTMDAKVDRRMGLEECREACLGDCACVAFSTANISGGGSGCVRWVKSLVDLREFASGGQELYVRVAAADSDQDVDDDNQSNGLTNKNKLILIIVISITLSFFFLNTCLCFLWKRKVQGNVEQSENLSLLNFGSNMLNGDENNSSELALFTFSAMVIATDKFSIANKLGEGGFGPVYKGNLSNGQEVAVKRLCFTSGQGFDELKNEVMLISRLQHKNLVRLLGFCVEGKEKMLIYEYMPNKSLDLVIFDPTMASTLDCAKRMKIVDGIAQGLLYLHKYSRLRVIHRDLKASNILLDAEMMPKISDFGMAKMFEGNQNQGNTKKIAGTYGYMPPEYVLSGIYSEKSDVFSFGVLLLEIVSGKRNAGFRCKDSWNLLAYTWELWEEGRALELVDQALGDSYSKAEILKCIHVALLCVQEYAEDRPTMLLVVSLLSGSSTSLPSIKQPAFLTTKRQAIPNLDAYKLGDGTANDVTITLLEAR